MITSITVLDTETADFDGGVCEIAGVVLQAQSFRGDLDPPRQGHWHIVDHHHSLCNPGRPISVEAMAVHHITDAMVADELPVETILDAVPIYRGADLPAAHNAEFDQGVMPRGWRARNLIKSVAVPADGILPTVDWIDTYRCARHLYPESPRFSNQVLRYHLGLDVSDMPAEAGQLVHRALFDTWCTAKMLLRMLQTHTPEQLIELSGTVINLASPPTRVGFGKHADLTWDQVPADYLRWILDKSDIDDPDQLHTARTRLGRPAPMGRLL